MTDAAPCHSSHHRLTLLTTHPPTHPNTNNQGLVDAIGAEESGVLALQREHAALQRRLLAAAAAARTTPQKQAQQRGEGQKEEEGPGVGVGGEEA